MEIVLITNCFCRASPAACLFALFLAGNLFLPIASFDHLSDPSNSYVQVLGNALPYGPWLNRATLLGPVVFAFALVVAWRSRRCPVFHWLDSLVGLWILTPTLVGVFNDSPFVADLFQSLYLALTWGTPYAASRMVFNSTQDLHATLLVLCMFGFVTFALALLEFAFGRFLYAVLYGFHPYYLEGVTRYVGYRPMLFFEDPNQIAMWWMTIAVASLTLLKERVPNSLRQWALLTLPTSPFLFQAFGASLLTLIGAMVLRMRHLKSFRIVVISILIMTMSAFALRGPVLRFGREFVDTNPSGKFIRSILRGSTIGSFGWRLGLEDDAYASLKLRPVFGSGSVNFWRTGNQQQERPWGFATLVAGAYGLVGVGVWGGMMLIPPCWILLRRNLIASAVRPIDGIATIVGLHCVDALLNSAYFLPVVFCLGLVVSFNAHRRIAE